MGTARVTHARAVLVVLRAAAARPSPRPRRRAVLHRACSGIRPRLSKVTSENSEKTKMSMRKPERRLKNAGAVHGSSTPDSRSAETKSGLHHFIQYYTVLASAAHP